VWVTRIPEPRVFYIIGFLVLPIVGSALLVARLGFDRGLVLGFFAGLVVGAPLSIYFGALLPRYYLRVLYRVVREHRDRGS
jgi:hypothetical protein